MYSTTALDGGRWLASCSGTGTH